MIKRSLKEQFPVGCIVRALETVSVGGLFALIAGNTYEVVSHSYNVDGVVTYLRIHSEQDVLGGWRPKRFELVKI